MTFLHVDNTLAEFNVISHQHSRQLHNYLYTANCSGCFDPSLSVCLSVCVSTKPPHKLRVDFHEIWGNGRIRTREKVIKFWKWSKHILHRIYRESICRLTRKAVTVKLGTTYDADRENIGRCRLLVTTLCRLERRGGGVKCRLVLASIHRALDALHWH